jgi:transposase
VPLWGGVAAGGFSIVLIHDRRKLTAEEWAEAVEAGKLQSAIQRLNPARRNGPWTVLCDNEAFLRAPASAAAHRESNVSLLKIPKKSPDLNPVELFWSWLRRALVLRDLEDLKQGRPTLGKTAFKARVRAVGSSVRARRVASACVNNLRKVCQEVVRLRGAATRF